MATVRSYRNGVWFAEVAAVVDTDILADGDLVGGKLTFASFSEPAGSGGVIESVIITDLDAEASDVDVIFFDADPSNTTFTENSALDINDTDLLNIIGVAQVTTWAAFADSAVGWALNLNMPFVIPSGTSLFAAMVVRGGGTPTYGTTSDLSVRVGVRPL